MISPFKAKAAILLAANLFVAGFAIAQVQQKDAPGSSAQAPKPQAAKEPADEPAIKLGRDFGDGFLQRHLGFRKELKTIHRKVGILFVGDSITDGWRGRGKDVFEKTYGSMDPFNIGIGGDRTQHVLWRLDHGEVEGISPKVAMLMIGTNNTGPNPSDEAIADGIKACVEDIHKHLPEAKILLLGVFPRSEKADAPIRARIKHINEIISKLDDGGKTVKYLDIGDKFLAADGTLPKDIMPDYLHPNAKGYQIWADAVKPTLDEMMK